MVVEIAGVHQGGGVNISIDVGGGAGVEVDTAVHEINEAQIDERREESFLCQLLLSSKSVVLLKLLYFRSHNGSSQARGTVIGSIRYCQLNFVSGFSGGCLKEFDEVKKKEIAVLGGVV